MLFINNKLIRRNQVKERNIWLNLISSYQVGSILNCIERINKKEEICIYDPFSGSGTTSYLSNKYGIPSFAADINPFLIWFGKTKSLNLKKEEIIDVKKNFNLLIKELENANFSKTKKLKVVSFLNFIKLKITKYFQKPKYSDSHNNLIWVSFCEISDIILTNHLILSLDLIIKIWKLSFNEIINSSNNSISELSNIFWHDSRNTPPINQKSITHVISSPPYPNQVNHLKILNNFMVSSDFISSKEEKEKLEMKLIGGCNFQKGNKNLYDYIEEDWVPKVLKSILTSSKISLHEINYLYSYVFDMKLHFQNIKPILRNNASLNYIIGDSRINNRIIRIHEILKEILENLGFQEVSYETLRKRKSDNHEYIIKAKFNNS